MWRVSVLLMVLILTACGRDPAGTSFDPYTRVLAIRSEEVRRVTGDGTILSARVVLLRGEAGQEQRAILTYVARADLNYPKIGAAWRDGRKLAYRKIDRQRAGRHRAEAGRIALTKGDMATGAHAGFRFRLIGPRGTYDIDLPPHLFSQVLDGN